MRRGALVEGRGLEDEASLRCVVEVRVEGRAARAD
jgi:hypothetical protein